MQPRIASTQQMGRGTCCAATRRGQVGPVAYQCAVGCSMQPPEDLISFPLQATCIQEVFSGAHVRDGLEKAESSVGGAQEPWTPNSKLKNENRHRIAAVPWCRAAILLVRRGTGCRELDCTTGMSVYVSDRVRVVACSHDPRHSQRLRLVFLHVCKITPSRLC
jgi:hypothetical protein